MIFYGWALDEIRILGEFMLSKNDFDERYNDMKVLVNEYENKVSYESAYLIKWQFIEKIVKELAEDVRKNQLLSKLKLWIDYLENENIDKPKEIKSFSVSPNRLPEIDMITKYFNKEMPKLANVLNTESKFRKKRNKIAHNFEPFKKKETYEEYSCMLDEAISELQNELTLNSDVI